MFNRASSDVFSFGFIGYFSQLVMAHRQPSRLRPHQNGCAGSQLQERDVS